ncbi:glycosyltransferase family 4 protein, partial [Nocardioides sp.]|uniref:glycosyltransferase family 4 protein n=1 Tax=Nocardioides sp. TaxID=35761 RepID=UPI00286DDA4A
MDVFVMAPTYYPAHKTGGPVPGIRGVVGTLGGHRVRMLTADRDLGEVTPFPAPYRGTTEVDGIEVTYLAPLGAGSWRSWWHGLREMRRSDVVYFNSVMHKTFTVAPLLFLALIGFRGRVAISPRGELAPSALDLGGARQKRLWLKTMTLLGLAGRVGTRRRPNVVWLASSEHERGDILAVFADAIVVLSPERLRELDVHETTRVRPRRRDGLRIVSLGRVSPVKGTLDLVRALQHVEVPTTLELVGHLEDAAYVEKVRRAAATLPSHIEVNWHGAVPPDEVRRLLDEAHLMVLLTRGENFGHAIGEALQRGCPVLISDQTPWSFVAARGAGTVLTEQECRTPARTAEGVATFARLTDEEWTEMSERAREVGARGLVIE